MNLKKSLLVLTALMLPLASIALLEGTAIAGKVTGTGSTTCSFGGTLTFNPPLTAAGSTSIKKEVTSVNTTLGSCSGGTPVGVATSVAVKPIKTKTAKGKAGGTCGSFDSAASGVVVKVKVNWNGEKPSKFSVAGLHASINGLGEVGFTGSFANAGSYAGSGHLAVYLTPASSNAIVTCSGSVGSLSIDRTQSSGTF